MCCIPYFLIISIQISNGLIIGLLAISIILFFKKGLHFDYRKFLFLGIPFWIGCLGLIYSSNFKVGLSIMETRAPIFLFPLVFSLVTPNQQDRVVFLRNFVASLVLTFVVLFVIAVYRNYLDPWTDIWFNQWYYHYDNLTEPIDIQPLYLSLFVSLGLVVVLLNHLGSLKVDVIPKRLRLVILSIFCVFLVMLGVRSTLLITIFLIVLIFVRNKFVTKKKNLMIVGFITISLIGMSILSPVTSGRFKGLFKPQYSFSNYSLDRLIIWSVALNHIKSKPMKYVFGNGTGTSENVMHKLYKEQRINWDFEKKTNTHNQFLEFTLDTGYFGAAILILYLVILFSRFYSSQNRIGELFVVLMLLAMISENYLNRQKGVVFFSLFLSLLAFEKDSEPSESGAKRIQSEL